MTPDRNPVAESCLRRDPCPKSEIRILRADLFLATLFAGYWDIKDRHSYRHPRELWILRGSAQVWAAHSCVAGFEYWRSRVPFKIA